ncbi:hypothetical protein [Ehrlichia japonica]|nr:hypothetical protein [Ehrlichia japonica]
MLNSNQRIIGALLVRIRKVLSSTQLISYVSTVLSGIAYPFQYICMKLLSSRNPTYIDNEPVEDLASSDNELVDNFLEDEVNVYAG